jgi:anaerobic selenocysteine-containing dehydrogenase
MIKNETVRSTCHLCYHSCGVLIHIKNGRPINVEGDPDNPMSKGKLCPKGLASLEYLNHPDRLKRPLKRIGEKGKGNWQEISWDEALELVAERLMEIKEKYGALSLIFIRGAAKGLQDDYFARFANIFGCPNISSPAPICFVPGINASNITYGYYAFPDYEYSAKCIVAWGANPEATHVTEYEEILNAVKKGAKLIVIGPTQSELSKKADLWIRLRPSTDLALALGIMNVIINENVYDANFVDKWTFGFDKLKTHVQDYPLDKVKEITWVPKEQIIKAARLYSMERPGCILWGNGIETTINSFQACRAIAILRSITGNLGIPGGEVKWSDPGGMAKGAPEFVCQNNISPEVRAKRLSIKDNLIPIAFYALPQRIIKAILDGDPYPIHGAYLQGGNMLTSYPNVKETYKALTKLDFLAVSDMFMTPTAMLADIVLPVATYLEFDSVERPWPFPIISLQQKVAQVHESWPDGKILNELTKKLGFQEYAWNNINESLDLLLKPTGITFQEFRNIGVLIGTKIYRHFEKNGFDTPSKKVELYSKRLEEWGFDPLPIYYEPPETPYSEPELAKEYPFILTSRKVDVYRHSGGRQIPSLRAARPEPIVKMHHETADKLGIRKDDWVYIATKRGRIRQKAYLDSSLDPRVVEVDYAWWFPEKEVYSLYGWEESNINILTSDKPPYNPEMGSITLRGIFCKVYKASETTYT